MAADTSNDLELLNALVDGELAPSARAAMAARLANEPELARAHATLARLKAEVGGLADDVEPAVVRMPQPSSRRFGVAVAGAVAAAALIAAVFAFPDLPMHRRSAVMSTVQDAQFAAGKAGMIVPDLAAAGLELKGVDRTGAAPFERVTAVYTGPRGCRLELRIQPSGAGAFPPSQATRLHRWHDGEFDYELAAFGMPLVRFAMIADAAERKTRVAGAPDQAERRLREARNAAPPCTG